MHFDRFDILEAHYCYYRDYHWGQNDWMYHRLSRISSYFRPSYSVAEYGAECLTENGKEIYRNLGGEV